MKRKTLIIMMLILSAMLLSSCGDAPKGVAIADNLLYVNCENTGNAGNYWDYSISDKKVIGYQSSDYFSTDEYQELGGEVGLQSFTFQGKKEGITNITFYCYRPSESEPFAERSFSVAVDEEENVILVEEKNLFSKVIDFVLYI